MTPTSWRVLSRQRLETRALNQEFGQFSPLSNAVNVAELEQKCRLEMRNKNGRCRAIGVESLVEFGITGVRTLAK